MRISQNEPSGRPEANTLAHVPSRRIMWIIPLITGVLLSTLSACAGGVGGDEGGIAVPDEGKSHVPVGTPIQYQNYPPTSGTHYDQVVRYGVYEEDISEGYWVHNLEHGAVVIVYNCPGGCPETVSQLKEAFKAFPPGKYGQVKIVALPYSKMKAKIAVLSWGWKLELASFDSQKVLAFYKAHVDRGPEDAP